MLAFDNRNSKKKLLNLEKYPKEALAVAGSRTGDLNLLMAFRANKFISEALQSQRTDSRTFGWISYFSFRRIKTDLWGFPKYLGCTLLHSKSDILCRNAKSLQPVYKKKSSRLSLCRDRTVDSPVQYSLDTTHAEMQRNTYFVLLQSQDTDEMTTSCT